MAANDQLAQEGDAFRNSLPTEIPQCIENNTAQGDMIPSSNQLDVPAESRDNTKLTPVTEHHQHVDIQQLLVKHDNNATTSVSDGNHGNTRVTLETDESSNSTVVTTITNIQLGDIDVTRTKPLKHKSPRSRPPKLAYTNRASLSMDVDATDYKSAAAKLQSWLAFNRRVNREAISVDDTAVDTRPMDAFLPSLVDAYFYDNELPTIRSKWSRSSSRNKPDSVDRNTPSSYVSESSVLYKTGIDGATLSLEQQTQLVQEVQSSPQPFNSRQRELMGTVELKLDDPANYTPHGIVSDRRFDGAFVGTRILRQCPLVDSGLATFSSEVPTERLIPITSLLAAMDVPVKSQRTTSESARNGFAISSTHGRHIIPATSDRSV